MDGAVYPFAKLARSLEWAPAFAGMTEPQTGRKTKLGSFLRFFWESNEIKRFQPAFFRVRPPNG